MSLVDKTFSSQELSILKRAIGRKLENVEAAIIARDNLSWNRVRLHFEGLHLDISNTLGEIEVDELGTLEEFGLLSVTEAPEDSLELPEVSVKVLTIELGMVIEAVEIVSDHIDVHGDEGPVATIEYPQAIVFKHEGGALVFDKECWFSEMIAIKCGDAVESLVYDDSINWEDDLEEDPTTHYEFKTILRSV